MARRMWQRGPDGEIVRAPFASEEPVATPEPAVGAPRSGRARLGLALRLGGRDTYDHLGALILVSVIWSVLAGLGLAGGHALSVVLFGGGSSRFAVLLSVLCAGMGLVAVGSPVTAGVFRYTRQATARLEPELFDLAWGFRGGFGRAVGLGSLQALGAVVLAGNCYFYLLQCWPVLVVVGAVFGYLLGFWLLACLYQWPLLIEQDLSPPAAIKKSALLVLDNFPYTLGLGVLVALLTALCWATVLGGVVLWTGAAAMFLTQATRELLRKYGVLGPDPTLDPMAEETHEFDGYGRHE